MAPFGLIQLLSHLLAHLDKALRNIFLFHGSLILLQFLWLAFLRDAYRDFLHAMLDKAACEVGRTVRGLQQRVL